MEIIKQVIGFVLGIPLFFGGGTGTIDQLQLFKATSSPWNAITTVSFAKNLYLQGSWATSTGMTAGTFCLTGDICITAWPTGGGSGFSTTSADYWLTVRQGAAFSTTSADYWGGTKGYITGIAWGAITGTLTNQADLNAKFSTKLGTSSVLTANQVLYATAFNTVASVGTSTPSVTAPITYSGTLGKFIDGVSGSFGCTSASSGVTGCLTGTDWTTFNAKESALTFTSPLIRAANTISYSGIATSSALTAGQFLATNSANQVYSVASSSLTANPSASVGSASATNGSATTFMRSDAAPACTAATASVPGCLAAADFATFSAKLASSSIQSSSMLAALLSDETGTGFAVFSASPTFTGGVLINAASSTINGNATTTGTFYAAVASSTNTYGANLKTCNSGNVLTWSAGLFGCAADANSGSYPFTGTSYNSTSTLVQFTGGITASASSTIGAPTATTTLLGNVMIGNAANSGRILGTTTPLQVSGSFNSYLQMILWNTHAGSNASTNLVLNNGSSTDTSYFVNVGINGRGYTNALFSGERGNDMFLHSSDGGMVFSLASTTCTNALCSFRWLTKGTQSAQIRMEMFNGGQLLLGTTTVDVSRGIGLAIATSTMWGAQVGQYIASTTDPTVNVTIDWQGLQSNTVRVTATTSKNIIINSTSSRPIDGAKYILKLCQDGTGGRVFTFSSSIALRWANGTTTGPTTANTCTFIGMQYDASSAIYSILASSTAVKSN